MIKRRKGNKRLPWRSNQHGYSYMEKGGLMTNTQRCVVGGDGDWSFGTGVVCNKVVFKL